MFNFPDSPTINQVFGNYTWDGVKWVQTSIGISPSSSNPLMDSTAAPGVSLLYSRGDHVHPSDTSRLALAGGTLTGALALAADPAVALGAATKQYVDAHAFQPILSINGAMSVSQELGFGSATLTALQSVAKYVCDGFVVGVSAGPALSAGNAANATGVAGITNAIQMNVTTPKASLAAGDYIELFQPIEGIRIARLGWGTAAAQPISIGFYVNCSIAGTLTISIGNAASARTYLVDVAIAAANTWQWVAVTVPGDVAGTWNSDSTVGMNARLCVAAGTTWRGVAGWQAGNFLGTASTMNLASSTNAIYFASFIVLPGSILPPPAAVPLVLPAYDQELAACQRYYEKGTFSFIGYTAVAASYLGYGIFFRALKRAAPTLSTNGISITNATALNADLAAVDGCRMTVQVTAAGSATVTAGWTADARL